MSEGVADICQWLAGGRGDGTTGHWSVSAVVHDVQLVSVGVDVSSRQRSVVFDILDERSLRFEVQGLAGMLAGLDCEEGRKCNTLHKMNRKTSFSVNGCSLLSMHKKKHYSPHRPRRVKYATRSLHGLRGHTF